MAFLLATRVSKQPLGTRWSAMPQSLLKTAKVETNVMPNPAPECLVIGPDERVRLVNVIMSSTMHINMWYIAKRGYHIKRLANS